MPGPIPCRAISAGRECRTDSTGFANKSGEVKHAKKCCPDLLGARGGVRVKRIAPALGK